MNKQKHQIDKKVCRQDHYVSTRLTYASKKIRDIYSSMVTTNYNSTQVIINKLQSLKGKTKIKFYQEISKYYDEKNNGRQSNSFQFEEDPFGRKNEIFGKIHHEVLLLMNFVQIKPQVKNMKMIYYDFYYTVIKSRNEKELVNDESEFFKDFIIPSQYIGRNKDNVMLRQRKLEL